MYFFFTSLLSRSPLLFMGTAVLQLLTTCSIYHSIFLFLQKRTRRLFFCAIYCAAAVTIVDVVVQFILSNGLDGAMCSCVCVIFFVLSKIERTLKTQNWWQSSRKNDMQSRYAWMICLFNLTWCMPCVPLFDSLSLLLLFFSLALVVSLSIYSRTADIIFTGVVNTATKKVPL